MNKCVVRRTIKEATTEKIIGYELFFQNDGDDLYEQDNATADAISEFFMDNSNKIFNDKKVFITLTPSLLFRNTARVFDKKKVVIQIEDNLIIHPLATPIMKKYFDEGYDFAINDFQFSPKYLSFLDFAKYVRLKISADMSDSEQHTIENIVEIVKKFEKKCIATDLDTKEDYDKAIELGMDYLEGAYIAETLTQKADKVTYVQGNFFQLVAAVSKDEPDMEEIEGIVSRDAGLTYAILKLVNSAYFALRRRTASIRQALMTLGIGQLRQWVYMLSFNNDRTDGADEMLKLSFLRASFAQMLAERVKNCPISKSEAYMMGMFSTLSYMVDAPLEELLAEIPIGEDIKDGLIKGEGVPGSIYQMVICYENADWKRCQSIADELGLNVSGLSQIYMNCVEEVNNIWDSITTDFERPGEEKMFPDQVNSGERIEDVLV